jgi:hypothetical protein
MPRRHFERSEKSPSVLLNDLVEKLRRTEGDFSTPHSMIFASLDH